MDDWAVFGGKDAPQIVIVDNDAADRRALLMLLKSHGFEAKAYALGRSLIGDPKALRARLLIAESAMPDMDGFALRRAFQDAGWNGSALMLTAHDGQLKQEAHDSGFDSVVRKPYRDHALMDCITDLLNGA